MASSVSTGGAGAVVSTDVAAAAVVTESVAPSSHMHLPSSKTSETTAY